MGHQKILHLLNEANDSKFVTRKWNIVNDHSKANYDAINKITYAENLDLVVPMYNFRRI